MKVWYPLRDSRGLLHPIPYDFRGLVRYVRSWSELISILMECFISEERCKKYCDKLNWRSCD